MNRFQINTVVMALDDDDKLSEWEHGFIDSLAAQSTDIELSGKQSEILNRIRKKLDFS